MMRGSRLIVAALGVVVLSAALSDAKVLPAAKCAAAKMKAVAKKMSNRLKCYEKAALAGTVADSACLQLADTKFFGEIDKDELQVGCPNTGDASTIEQAADTGVGSIIALAPAIAMCPSTAHEGDACGSCGNGECILHAGTLTCIDSHFDNNLCSSDADCAAGSVCNLTIGGICFPACP
jgi:hypothetical protein